MKEGQSSKIVTGMLWRFGEKITAQVVSFVVSIVLARILMPEDYGVVAMVTVFMAITEIFVTSGLGTALIQKKDADQLDFSTVFWCNIVLSAVIYGVIFLSAPLVAKVYKTSLLTKVLRIFGLRIPISAFNSIQNAYVSRRMDFKKFFFSTIIGTIISAIIGIVMALKGFGVWALIAQYLSNAAIDTIILFITVGWRPTLQFSQDRAKPLVSYGWKILATDLIGTIFNQLNSFVIGIKYTKTDLAYYTQGKKIPDLINNNISATLTAVLFPAMSLSSDYEEIKRIRRKSLMMLEYVLFPIMVGMMTIADNMIEVLLTDKWMFAVPYVRIACLDALLSILGTTLIQEIKAIGRSDITLKLELMKKPIYFLVILIAMRISVRAIAWTLIINGIIAFIFNVYPVRKYIGFDFWLYIKDAIPTFVITIVMSGCVFVVGKLIKNVEICLLIQIMIGALIYLILSVITQNKSYTYLVGMIKSKLKG